MVFTILLVLILTFTLAPLGANKIRNNKNNNSNSGNNSNSNSTSNSNSNGNGNNNSSSIITEGNAPLLPTYFLPVFRFRRQWLMTWIVFERVPGKRICCIRDIRVVRSLYSATDAALLYKICSSRCAMAGILANQAA